MNGGLVISHLKTGIRHFQRNVYAHHAEMYRRVGMSRQQPHTLMIACADSRVDVQQLTGSQPGELFATRNIGNMVPEYGGIDEAVSAVIEYAVSALKVEHIVICGHSDCGAMKALLDPSLADPMPSVKAWLSNGHAALNGVDDQAEQRLRILTEENVLMQLAHLKTYPCVASGLARQEITLSGWIYEIATGEVRIAEKGARPFQSVTVS